MRRALLVLVAVAIFAQFGCVGMIISVLKSDADNLVAQKDFVPDPDFAKFQPERQLARPYTAKDIAKIPGVICLEAIGTNGKICSVASGFMVPFAGKPHVASAGHFCKGPEYVAIFAYFSEGREEPEEVEIVAADELLDLCLLRFKNPKFQYSAYPHLGNSAKLQKGDRVFTHGSPFDFDFSLSEGIVDKLDFGISYVGIKQPQMIQHSAKINPGDSGGPLFNEQGQIVGMNVMGFPAPQGRRPDITTIYGAIPIDDIITVFRHLKESGYATHASIGWALTQTSWLSRFDYQRRKIYKPEKGGVMIYELEKDGPADKAGLKPGDILLEYDGRKPENVIEVARYVLFERQPGDTIQTKVYREEHSDKEGNKIVKKELTVSVKLEKR